MSKKSIHTVEKGLKLGDWVILYDGEILTVKKYDKNAHLITFTNGKSSDLYEVYDNYIAEIRHPVHTSITKETKENSKSMNMVEKEKRNFSLYALASGKPGKKYTIKQFLQITKDAKKKPGGANTEKTIILNDGYVYEADSQQEISTIKKLISHNAFKKLRGQCINIPYKFDGKIHNYYPDFIILTQTNKIVIMEVKEIVQMNSKVNIRKYEALKRYCLKNGFLYIMCDKSFKPFERLANYSIGSKVEEAIDEALEERGYFDYLDYKKLIEDKDHKKVKKIRNHIGIYITSRKGVKMVGDMTFRSADFRIIKVKKKKHKK